MTTSIIDLTIRPDRERPQLQAVPRRGIADPASALVQQAWLRPTLMAASIMMASALGLFIAIRLHYLPRFNVAHVVILSLAITAMHTWLTQALGVPWMVSIPTSVLYLAHPLLRQIVIEESQAISRIVLVLIPLIGLCVNWSVRHGRLLSRMMLGGFVGVAAALLPTGAWLLIGATVVWAVFKTHERRSISSIVRGILRDVVVVGITTGGTMLVTQLAMNQLDIHIAPTLGLPPVEVTPFALVDRSGWVSSRLASIPLINASVGGAWYIGWSSMLLALAGVVMARTSCIRQRLGTLLALAMLVLWCGVGADSLHGQLREMFEFVTVKRRVDSMTLHLVGLLMLPVMILASLLFRAIANVVGPSRQQSSFTTVVLAACAVLFWWTTSPAILPAGLGVPARAIWSSALPPVLLAFGLSSSAAVGLIHLLQRCSKRRYAYAVWMLILGLTWIDLTRGATWTSSNATVMRPLSSSQPTN